VQPLSDTPQLATARGWRALADWAVSRPILALAPLLVLFVAVSLWFPAHPSDERGYLTLAHDLVHGEYTGLGWRPASPYASPDPNDPDLWFGPGLPLLLAPLVALDLPVELVRLTGPLFLFLAVLVFYGLLQLFVTRGLALVGALSVGLYVPFYSLLPNLHSEPLAILAIVGMLYLLALYVRTGRWLYGGGAGVAAAYVALTRVGFGWVLTAMLVLFVGAWLVSRRTALGRIAAVYGIGLALCLPWLAYTHSVTGRAIVWGNSGSLSLYWMSSPYPQDLGDWRGGAYEVVVSDPRLVHHRAFFRELSRLDPSEQNRRLEDAAFRNIREHPAKFAKNVAANVSRMWFDVPFSEKPEHLNVLYYLVPNSLILWSLLAGAIVLVARRSRLPAEMAGFAAFAAIGFGLHAVLAAYPRMLMPLIPIALFFVVYAFALVTNSVATGTPPRVDGALEKTGSRTRLRR
jgi:hypothetical protein